MSLTFKRLYQKVLLRLNESDGRALLAAKDAVNDAHKFVARAHDFDELITLDTTNAFTQVNIKTYDLEDDWGLTRPKSIYSIRYMDGNMSRKLSYVSPRTVDEVNPYPEGSGVQKPQYYTRRGELVELIPVPDAVGALYIQYSQWPLVLEGDDDVSTYSDEVEDVLVALGADIAQGILGGGHGDWVRRAKELLGLATIEDVAKPDRTWIAQPFLSTPTALGEYWKDPFVKRNP